MQSTSFGLMSKKQSGELKAFNEEERTFMNRFRKNFGKIFFDFILCNYLLLIQPGQKSAADIPTPPPPKTNVPAAGLPIVQ